MGDEPSLGGVGDEPSLGGVGDEPSLGVWVMSPHWGCG